MNEIQLAAHDLLMSFESTGHAHNAIQGCRPEWEFAGNQSGWIQSHVTSVEGDDAQKIASNACINIADEVRGSVFDAIHNSIHA